MKLPSDNFASSESAFRDLAAAMLHCDPLEMEQLQASCAAVSGMLKGQRDMQPSKSMHEVAEYIRLAYLAALLRIDEVAKEMRDSG